VLIAVAADGEAHLEAPEVNIPLAAAAEYRKEEGFMSEGMAATSASNGQDELRMEILEERLVGRALGNLPAKLSSALAPRSASQNSGVLRRLAIEWLSSGSLEFRGPRARGGELSTVVRLHEAGRKMLREALSESAR
jgi:hypothetical protein